MTLKSDAKFEEKLTLRSKNDVRNLMNFNASSVKSESLLFDVLLSKAYKVSAKKVQNELFLMTLKSDPNSEVKLTFCLKNDMRNLVNFNASNRKSENLQCENIYVMFELKKYRGLVS